MIVSRKHLVVPFKNGISSDYNSGGSQGVTLWCFRPSTDYGCALFNNIWHNSLLSKRHVTQEVFSPVFIAVATSVVWLWTRPHYSTLRCRIRPCSKQTSPHLHWSKKFSLNWIQEVVTYLSKPIWESHYVTVNGPWRENELFLLAHYLPKHFSKESEIQCANQLTQSFRFCHLATDDTSTRGREL